MEIGRLIRTKAQKRMVAVLASTFVSTLAVYGIAYFLFEPLALGVVVAWATSVTVLFIYVERRRAGILGLEDQYRNLRAYINLQSMLGETFVPYSFWAMEPGSLLNLLATIQYHDYRTIVECGAGLSTVLIGKLLKQVGGGHIYSLEDDEGWHAVMSAAIAEEGLAEYITLLYSPLEENSESGELWYGQAASQQILARVGEIDLLVVDGPKSNAPLSRMPALPIFAPKLSHQSLIVLDDSKRENEQQVLRSWGERFNLEIEQKKDSLRGQTYIRIVE